MNPVALELGNRLDKSSRELYIRPALLPLKVGHDVRLTSMQEVPQIWR